MLVVHDRVSGRVETARGFLCRAGDEQITTWQQEGPRVVEVVERQSLWDTPRPAPPGVNVLAEAAVGAPALALSCPKRVSGLPSAMVSVVG